MIGAVAAGHIINDALASFNAKVYIKIRHADALRIQKTLEQQTVFQRVDVRDADAVSTKTACAGASARSDRNVM